MAVLGHFTTFYDRKKRGRKDRTQNHRLDSNQLVLCEHHSSTSLKNMSYWLGHDFCFKILKKLINYKKKYYTLDQFKIYILKLQANVFVFSNVLVFSHCMYGLV